MCECIHRLLSSVVSCFHLVWANNSITVWCLFSNKETRVSGEHGWRLSLPQTGREAAHVLRHPAVVCHHCQLRPPHLVQVSRSSPSAVKVGAALVWLPPCLDAGAWYVTLWEEKPERGSFPKSTPMFYYLCFQSVWWHTFTSLVSCIRRWAALNLHVYFQE